MGAAVVEAEAVAWHARKELGDRGRLRRTATMALAIGNDVVVGAVVEGGCFLPTPAIHTPFEVLPSQK